MLKGEDFILPFVIKDEFAKSNCHSIKKESFVCNSDFAQRLPFYRNFWVQKN
jgi:hypothetical protein